MERLAALLISLVHPSDRDEHELAVGLLSETLGQLQVQTAPMVAQLLKFHQQLQCLLQDELVRH